MIDGKILSGLFFFGMVALFLYISYSLFQGVDRNTLLAFVVFFNASTLYAYTNTDLPVIIAWGLAIASFALVVFAFFVQLGIVANNNF